MPESLLLSSAGEGRSESLYIGTVASSFICEFNHALVESFGKVGFVLQQHRFPPGSFADGERRDFGGGLGGEKGNSNKIIWNFAFQN